MNTRGNKNLILHILTVLVTAVVLAFLMGEVTRPKFYNDNYWPLDVTYESFYEMEKDTVDVLFLGSSHAISAFSPQELYDATGIRSFNLGSEEQSLLISYYWLKEALRFQHPKAVVLDTIVCFPLTETPYNCSEPSIRKSLDPMKWSSVKLEAVSAIHRLDAEQTFASYVFPVIRYHSRWRDLVPNDFRLWPSQRTDLKGYAVLSEDYNEEDYKPLTDTNAQPSVMHGLMRQYLEQITKLCKDNEIQLILVNTPYTECSAPIHAAVQVYAREQELTYIDYNEASVYETLDFDFAHDMADAGHANTSGAAKLTAHIAKVLVESGIQPIRDNQYENSRAYCLRQIKNANLYRIRDYDTYMHSFDRNDYLIFVTGSGEAEAALLGLQETGPFAAVYEEGTPAVYPNDHSAIDWKQNVRYSLHSEEKSGSIRVYDLTYERTGEGLQIVLLDKEKGYVIDHSIFDSEGSRIQ